MSITLILLIITAVVTYSGFNNPDLKAKLMFNPYRTFHYKEWHRLLGHGFIHADMMHAFFNLFVLYSFGNAVEGAYVHYFGVKSSSLFLLLYLGGIVASSLITLSKHKDNPGYNALGASGAVSAVVFSAIAIHPTMELGILFIPIGIPGWIFGILYLAYSQYMSKKNMDNIGHDAHIWGAVYGFLITMAFRPDFLVEFFDQIVNN